METILKYLSLFPLLFATMFTYGYFIVLIGEKIKKKINKSIQAKIGE